jgi:DNA-binding NarL/FixJ family response regulator
MEQKVMIVDAHPVYAPKIAAFLEGLTFKNIEIVHKSGLLAGRLQEFRPDVLILSGMLPDTDSVELLKGIKAQAPSLPVIVQTGLLCTEEKRSAFVEAGAAAVLPRLEKDLGPLQSAIQTLLRR